MIPDWRSLTPSSITCDPELRRLVEEFTPIERPLGHRAARWLREEAAENDGSTKTYCLAEEGRLAGFFSICAGEVRLSRKQVAELNVPIRARQPAITMPWIARHRDATGVGPVLLETAYGLARRVARDIGALAFVLDPGDDELTEYWKGLGFRESLPRWDSAPLRLWVPLVLTQEER